MRDFKFDSEETKDYYLQSLRQYHVGVPNWNLEQVISLTTKRGTVK